MGSGRTSESGTGCTTQSQSQPFGPSAVSSWQEQERTYGPMNLPSLKELVLISPSLLKRYINAWLK